MESHDEIKNHVKDIEDAALERHLSEEAIFRQSLDGTRRHYRKIIISTAGLLSVMALVWGFWSCPILQKINLCPWANQSQGYSADSAANEQVGLTEVKHNESECVEKEGIGC